MYLVSSRDLKAETAVSSGGLVGGFCCCCGVGVRWRVTHTPTYPLLTFFNQYVSVAPVSSGAVTQQSLPTQRPQEIVDVHAHVKPVDVVLESIIAARHELEGVQPLRCANVAPRGAKTADANVHAV